MPLRQIGTGNQRLQHPPAGRRDGSTRLGHDTHAGVEQGQGLEIIHDQQADVAWNPQSQTLQRRDNAFRDKVARRKDRLRRLFSAEDLKRRITDFVRLKAQFIGSAKPRPPRLLGCFGKAIIALFQDPEPMLAAKKDDLVVTAIEQMFAAEIAGPKIVDGDLRKVVFPLDAVD